MCPPGSLHDQIVKQWGNIRSYVMKDGHLFLSLMADGGIYEFEPATKSQAREASPRLKSPAHHRSDEVRRATPLRSENGPGAWARAHGGKIP